MPRPDEGRIHAWLDGQLPPEEAARIEELAATDPEWAAAVAEARGLVAASSRILAALDRVPADVVPRSTASRTMRMPWWTKIAAAVVVVVGGSVVVLQNTPEERRSGPSAEQRSVQPTLDASKSVAQAPITAVPVPRTEKPAATSGVRAAAPTAAPTTGTPADADLGRGDVSALRREARAMSRVTPPAAPAPSAGAIVAEERKTVQDASRAVAELSAAKMLVAKAAPVPAPVPAPLPTSPAQPATTQDVAQVQNAVPAQRVMGGIAAAQIAPAQQANLCYRIVADSARTGVAVIMRVVRADGDTLRLVPVEQNALQRAWIIWRDGMTGIMTTSGDLQRAVRIVATPTTCPTP